MATHPLPANGVLWTLVLGCGQWWTQGRGTLGWVLGLRLQKQPLDGIWDPGRWKAPTFSSSSPCSF